MPVTLEQFQQQLSRCAMSPEEVSDFIEAFADVRVQGVVDGLSAVVTDPPFEAMEAKYNPDWTDPWLLGASGLTAGQVQGHNLPSALFLHYQIALAATQPEVSLYIQMSGYSDKMSRALLPILSSAVARRKIRTAKEGNELPAGLSAAALSAEVTRVNRSLAKLRSQGFDPLLFLPYHRHVGIHGGSGNDVGKVGTLGAAIAIHDALLEIDPTAIKDMVGQLPPAGARTPAAIFQSMKAKGFKPLQAILLRNGRCIAVRANPDVAIFQSLDKSYDTATDALKEYEAVRQHKDERQQKVHEFVVGEIKTATDPANLHERLALGGRDLKDEVQADRFLMMAALTPDIVHGGTGRKSGRQPLQNKDVVRFSDVFNLYYAWGWNGARERHPEHWLMFKKRLAFWCGLPQPAG
ncbi:hypothetical protein [Azospirillum thermophilum]|uniref:Uncharacterized protein n=1 Tax=Azospirillum thermophilum TaxID=2202148 RepID=A0A2S2CKK4_9PROT|nr:hypothetical protein [Azospirillum thermophilum]AWK85002.1 hypothetical protein DEW08_01340 [Azospirillum thermophilum]